MSPVSTAHHTAQCHHSPHYTTPHRTVLSSPRHTAQFTTPHSVASQHTCRTPVCRTPPGARSVRRQSLCSGAVSAGQLAVWLRSPRSPSISSVFGSRFLSALTFADDSAADSCHNRPKMAADDRWYAIQSGCAENTAAMRKFEGYSLVIGDCIQIIGLLEKHFDVNKTFDIYFRVCPFSVSNVQAHITHQGVYYC